MTTGRRPQATTFNLLRVLRGSGGSPANLAKVTAYIVGVSNWTAFNEVYGRIMGPIRPARTVVPLPELHFGYLVEVDAIAVGLERDRSEPVKSLSTG